jgi:hypothetical protein
VPVSCVDTDHSETSPWIDPTLRITVITVTLHTVVALTIFRHRMPSPIFANVSTSTITVIPLCECKIHINFVTILTDQVTAAMIVTTADVNTLILCYL